MSIFKLKDGHSTRELELGPYGYAVNAGESYSAFKRLREQGVIPPGTRYQVTLPGPGTSAFFIELPADDLFVWRGGPCTARSRKSCGPFPPKTLLSSSISQWRRSTRSISGGRKILINRCTACFTGRLHKWRSPSHRSPMPSLKKSS